jgi:hypothetical protein
LFRAVALGELLLNCSPASDVELIDVIIVVYACLGVSIKGVIGCIVSMG